MGIVKLPNRKMYWSPGKKWGYTLWARAGINVYVYEFEVDGSLTSKGPPENSIVTKNCGESDFAVTRLANKLEKNKHFLPNENYFSSPELAVYLKQKKEIFAVSTPDRKLCRKCLLPSNNKMMEEERGKIFQFVDKKSQVVITAWLDNKPVLMLSNYLAK